MQIGISLPHFRHLASPDAIRRIAQHAEAIGLDSVWVGGNSQRGIRRAVELGDCWHEFKQLGVSHMVVDLFYSTSFLEDATVDSMVEAMEVLANDVRPVLKIN
jgi:alkanesulfonate monooxygenase SsuD/methylene tetrahydromethanopterin reductase-like flavin-dependent oxidoreductase (luciferase family)